MNSEPLATLWTLEELSQLSQNEMERRRIPSPGGRVSQIPSARTIRYYTSLGLVDRPNGYDGGLAQYGQRHLKQLLAIKILQSEYLPLPEIQKQLYGRTDEELNQLIETAKPESNARSNVLGPQVASGTDWPSNRTSQVEGRPELTSWLCSSIGPGVQLVISDRSACLAWLSKLESGKLERTVLDSIQSLQKYLTNQE
jgi:DNA-binding transcriptional MerR regulator